MNSLTHVKWISANLPVINHVRTGTKLYLTKRELKDLRDQIDIFIRYYKEDFKEPNIGWEDVDEYEYYTNKKDDDDTGN